MQVGATPPVLPVQAASPAVEPPQAQIGDKAAQSTPIGKPEPFTPAPPLRPTIQDRIEIDLALMALRAEGA